MNRVFISYSGDRIERALLYKALKDHGLRPWRDVENQDVGDRTTEEIEAELAECSTVILWLNGQVLASDYVTEVELPAIARRWQDGLRIVPVFDGIGAAEAFSAVSKRTGIELGDQNGHRIDTGLSAEQNAALIARRLITAVVYEARTKGAMPIVRLVSYDDTASLRDDAVVNLDWRHRVVDDGIEQGAEGLLRDALVASTGALKNAYGACEVTIAAKAHLPLAVALGNAFAAPTGCTLRLHRSNADWLTAVSTSGASALVERQGPLGPAGQHTAVLAVSVSREVEAGVNDYVMQGNRYRHRIKLEPNGGPGRATVDSAQTANAWARQIGESLVALTDRTDIESVDLFMSCPVELAVLVGWRSNAIGSVRLMNWRGKAGPFERMWTVP